jgi:hypothetical protein
MKFREGLIRFHSALKILQTLKLYFKNGCFTKRNVSVSLVENCFGFGIRNKIILIFKDEANIR